MLHQTQIEQLLLPKLEALEEERAAVHQVLKGRLLRSQLLVAFSMITVIGTCVIAALYDLSDAINALLPIGVILVLSITAGFYLFTQSDNKKLRERFQKTVKTAVYNEVFEAWNATASYSPEGYVQQNHFKKANLYRNFNRYTGDDYCQGTLPDGRRFQFSELNVQRVEQVSDDHTRTVPVFKGLFFVLENTLPAKDLDQSLAIQPKERTTKKQGKKKAKPKPKAKAPRRYNDNILDADISLPEPQQEAPIQEIEVPLFDQLYDITPSNFATRAKLSKEFCDNIVKMQTQQRQNIALHFVNNTAYMTCKHHLDFWPVQLELSMLSKARVRHVAWSFAVAFGLLQLLAEGTYADRPSAV